MGRTKFFIAPATRCYTHTSRSREREKSIDEKGRNIRFYRVKGTRFVRVYNMKIDEGPRRQKRKKKKRNESLCCWDTQRLLTFSFARLSFDVHKEEEDIKIQKGI